MDPLDEIRAILDEQPHDALSQIAEALGTEHSSAPSANIPIDMVLHCPACGLQHIDVPDAPDKYCNTLPDGSCDSNDPRCMHLPSPASRWLNPPHRSHLCAFCGHIWRPADVATNGVLTVKTKGENDSPITTSRDEP